MGLFWRKEKKDNSANEPVVAAIITNPVSSEIFQDILKENDIPFICRQEGAGGSVKLLFGGGIVPDYIYVSEENYECARGLYEAYLLTETETESTEEE